MNLKKNHYSRRALAPVSYTHLDVYKRQLRGGQVRLHRAR